MMEEWQDALRGLTAEEIASGFRHCRDTMAWPPSIADMLKASRPKKTEVFG